MKGAIFCILAFCAFQAVFANKLQELGNLREQALKNVHDVEYILRRNIADEGRAAHLKGLSYGSIAKCRLRVDFGWDFYFTDPKVQACKECHDEAAKQINVEIAKTCCLEQIAVLEERARKDRNFFTECITKLISKMEAPAGRGMKRKREDSSENTVQQ